MESNAAAAAGHGCDLRAVSVSVVVPAYNAAAYLTATLASVARQTAPAAELIVVDDGSTDDTAAIAASFGARVIALANGGASAARNAGTRAASGEYVAYLDADDIWLPDKLAVQTAALAQFGAPAFSFTDYRFFDARGTHPRRSELRRHWAFQRVARRQSARGDVVLRANGRDPVLYDSYIPPSSVMARRCDVLAVGGFDESLRVTEDFELFLRLFTRVPAVAVMRPLLLYRRHPAQATADAIVMKRGLIQVAGLVAATPGRYPAPDARYIAATEHRRYFHLGLAHARRGQFEEAAQSFAGSIETRWSASANLALAGAWVCRSATGRVAFNVVRTLWKNRPGRA